MGSVWEAVPISGGQPVALKLLLEPSAAATHRFFDEARRGQALDHPNVVRIFDHGKDGERVWMSMELLQGHTLASLLKAVREPWPLELVCGLAEQGLAGLEAVHQAFVHRDVKPSNLVLTDEGVLKLIDFGIAAGDELERTRTRTGTMRGSLPYTPPEQASGELVDRRGDLFSFGLVLHELLTGKRVFDQSNDAAILTALLLHPIASPQVSRPEVPSELSSMVMKALSRDRSERSATASEMAAALAKVPQRPWTKAQIARWLAAQPVPSMSVPNLTASIEPAQRPVTRPRARPIEPRRERTRALWWVPGLAALGLVAVAGALWLRQVSAEQARPAQAVPTVVEPTFEVAGESPEVVRAAVPQAPEFDAGVAMAAAPESPPPAQPRATPKSPLVRPRGSGFVTIDARPTYGNVTVDGKPVGVTPLARLQLSEGRHVIEVGRADGTVRRKTVKVSAGQEVRWVVTW